MLATPASFMNSGGNWQQNSQRGQFTSPRALGPKAKPERPVDVSDATVWKKATMLTQYFPGTFSEIEEKMEGLA